MPRTLLPAVWIPRTRSYSRTRDAIRIHIEGAGAMHTEDVRTLQTLPPILSLKLLASVCCVPEQTGAPALPSRAAGTRFLHRKCDLCVGARVSATRGRTAAIGAARVRILPHQPAHPGFPSLSHLLHDHAYPISERHHRYAHQRSQHCLFAQDGKRNKGLPNPDVRCSHPGIPNASALHFPALWAAKDPG